MTLTEAPSTTTTVAPTTTLSPEQEAIAAAEEAVVNAFDARTAALVDPANPDLREDLANYWTESAIPTLLAQMDDFVENSKVLVINDDPEAFLVILDGSVQVAPDRIDVPFCRLDSNIIVVRLEGIDAVLDDGVATERWTAAVVVADGAWKVLGAEVLNEADGEVECGELL